MVGVDREVRVFADLRPVPLLHARVAEDPNERDKLEVVLDLVGQPVQHLQRALEGRALLALLVAVGVGAGVEAVGQLHRLGVHLLDLLFDEFGVELEDWCFDPCGVVVVEGADHAPQINIRLNLRACSFQFGEIDFLAHLESDDIVVDDFLSFLEVADPALKLIDLGVGVVLLKALGELLELMYFSEQVGDICVELLDHAIHGFLQFRPLLLDPLLLDAHLCWQRIQQFGSLMQGLVVLLSEGVVDAVQELEPRFH